MSTDTIEINNITRDCYGILHVNKLENIRTIWTSTTYKDTKYWNTAVTTILNQ